MLLSCLFVFVAMAASDFIWAQCVIATTNDLPVKAALTSGVMILLNSVVVCVYVSNHWTILAATGGGLVGTYLSVKKFSHKRNKDG